MKKSILFLASLLVLATSCYEDYVRDFDYSGALMAYQYDLRTFVLDEGEHAAHAAYDAGLLAVVDMVAADDVAAHLFLQPAVILASANRVTFHLGRTLYVFIGKVMVVIRV